MSTETVGLIIWGGEPRTATSAFTQLLSSGARVVEVDEVLLYVHRNRRLIRDGEPRTATSTFIQLLSSVPERMADEPGIYLTGEGWWVCELLV